VLDEQTIPAVVQCGFNHVDVDRLTETRSLSAVWSWAPGYPLHPDSRFYDPSAAPSWALPPGPGPDALPSEGRDEASADAPDGPSRGPCVAMSVTDGRWYLVSCDAILPSACMESGSPYGEAAWEVLATPRGVCRQGWWFAAPFHPKSNWALREAIRAGGFEAAFLNIQGPDFATPSPPQATQP